MESVIDEGQAAGAIVRHDDTAGSTGAVRRVALVELTGGWRSGRISAACQQCANQQRSEHDCGGECRQRQLGPGASSVFIGYRFLARPTLQPGRKGCSDVESIGAG